MDRDRDEVEEKRSCYVPRILGDACRASDILYSTAILKKTGLQPEERSRLMFRLSQYMEQLITPTPVRQRRARGAARGDLEPDADLAI